MSARGFMPIKFNRLIALFVFLIVVISGMTAVHAAEIIVDPSDGIDAILVIDTSGSMRDADPDRIALEASSLFMDMMETRNSRIGIIAFSGGLHSVMPLTPIRDPSVRDEIRSTISRFVYHGWTDIGLALRTAAEMILDDPIPGNSPMILLFTDGRIELPDNWPDRDIETSYNDAWWAVDALDGQVPIYTIGLNFDDGLNIDFLQTLAARTHAQSYIAYEAGELPQIFNAIFASHIRSSITELATIVVPGVEYIDVLVPIPSAFVSEANIIMLSSQPLVNVRLFDPSGREIVFDETTYTLTYANRYSMIKILAPMVGDWLLSVQGIPEDRITVNLIYNYNIDVALHIAQEGAAGAFFDPTEPITVQAVFVSPLPGQQIQALFADASAEISIFDMEMNHIATTPMNNTGSSFTMDVLPAIPQDIRINVHVSHPGFEQTSTTVTITYDPEILAQLREEPDVNPEPTPEPAPPSPTPAPTPAPTPTPEDIGGTSATIFILLGIAVALVIAAILLRLYSIRQSRQKVFTGHLELRALLDDGNYTSLEVPDLSTFAGKISLMEFLNNSLGSKAEKIYQSNVPIFDIHIQPGIQHNQPIINLTTNGNCQITDGDGKILFQKKIVWENNQQLIFSSIGTSARLEATYRADEA